MQPAATSGIGSTVTPTAPVTVTTVLATPSSTSLASRSAGIAAPVASTATTAPIAPATAVGAGYPVLPALNQRYVPPTVAAPIQGAYYQPIQTSSYRAPIEPVVPLGGVGGVGSTGSVPLYAGTAPYASTSLGAQGVQPAGSVLHISQAPYRGIAGPASQWGGQGTTTTIRVGV